MRYAQARYWISKGQAKFADPDYQHFGAINEAFINRQPFNLLDCELSNETFTPVWHEFTWGKI